MHNALNWFEIPATNIDRAATFYETILGTKLKREDDMGRPMAMFIRDKREAVSGCVVQDPQSKPRTDGTIVYLNAEGKLDAALSRVEKAGGKVLLPKTDIGAPGFIAVVLDTEGNRVGLHSERAA